MNKEKVDKLGRTEKRVNIVKMIFEILGILIGLFIFLFAFQECSSEMRVERRATSIAKITEMKSREFIKSQTRLNFISQMSKKDSTDNNCAYLTNAYNEQDCNKAQLECFYEINYLFNTYENIGAMKEAGLVESAVLDATICQQAKEFNTIYTKLQEIYFPDQEFSDANFKALLQQCNE
jgi:hypothetical protein